MQPACIVLGAVLLLHGGENTGSSRPLTDAELEKVTAGNTNLSDSAGKGDTTAIVVNSSSATIRSSSIVNLKATSPGDSRALNFVNAAGSLVGQSVNILDAAPASAFRAPFLRLHQANIVGQSQVHFSHIERLEVAGPILREFSRQTSLSSRFDNRFFTSRFVDRSSSSRSLLVVTNVTVPGFNPFNRLLPLGSIAPNPFTILDPPFGFSINAIVGSEPFAFGFSAGFSVGPIHVQPPGVNFGSLDLRQDFLTISGASLTLPSVDVALSGQGTVCFFKCAGASGSTTFTLGFGALGTIPIPEIALGANPFKNIQINVGGGIAGFGSGTFDFQGGGAKLGVNFSLSLPPIPSVSLGFPAVTIPLSPFGDVDIPGFSFSTPQITFPTVNIPINLVDSSFGGFRVSFQDSAVCILILAPGDCGLVTALVHTRTETFQSFSITATMGSSSREEHTSEFRRQIIFPAALAGAQAGYIALTDSSLDVASGSAVQLSGPVQQGLRALNLVNAASSTLANAMNVTRIPTGGPSVSLSQSNAFNQRP